MRQAIRILGGLALFVGIIGLLWYGWNGVKVRHNYFTLVLLAGGLILTFSEKKVT